jgi:hypothetical protein
MTEQVLLDTYRVQLAQSVRKVKIDISIVFRIAPRKKTDSMYLYRS